MSKQVTPNSHSEKQTRYQVVVMGSQPTFSLQVFEEEKSVFEDSRLDTYSKSFSSFSEISGDVMVCMTNNDVDNSVQTQVQFYHGLHVTKEETQLQPGLDDIDFEGFTLIEEILAQSNQIQDFVKNSYHMNVKTLLDRNRNISNISTVMLITTAIFFGCLFVVRFSFMNRLIKQMRARKLI